MNVRSRLGAVAGSMLACAALLAVAGAIPVATPIAAPNAGTTPTPAARAFATARSTPAASSTSTSTPTAAPTPGARTSTSQAGQLVSADRTPLTGGMDLYRPGSFSTQGSWLWCTAADVQIVRNIVFGGLDHARATQQTYFDWMRQHNRYAIPVTDGVDPAGWAAGLRQFVDPGYGVVASATFEAALRAAVTSLRLGGLPVGLLVAHGNHAWILTGFTATADPASTTSFRVTSVSVVGPLYGRQSRGGYDMPPDTRLSPAELARFLTPFRDAVRPMIWDGSFVTIAPAAR